LADNALAFATRIADANALGTSFLLTGKKQWLCRVAFPPGNARIAHLATAIYGSTFCGGTAPDFEVLNP